MEPREKTKARCRSLTHYAVRTGRLIKQPCARCGSPEVQAHHEDYSKPLEVVWLCLPCHHALHRVESLG